jgi:mono/diheme cytochrome c family protein
LLEGSETAETATGPEKQKMRSFAKTFTDRQIAEVLSFIRNSWGNSASPATLREVALLRRTLEKLQSQ